MISVLKFGFDIIDNAKEDAIMTEEKLYWDKEVEIMSYDKLMRLQGLFYRLVQQATQIEPVAYKELVKHARGRKKSYHKI